RSRPSSDTGGKGRRSTASARTSENEQLVRGPFAAALQGPPQCSTLAFHASASPAASGAGRAAEQVSSVRASAPGYDASSSSATSHMHERSTGASDRAT